MTPDKIKNQLLSYYQQFKANLGLFKSFEVIFNYLNFIKAEPYLGDLLGQNLEYAEKQYYLTIDVLSDPKKASSLEKATFNLTDPSSFSKFPLFNKEFSSFGSAISSNNPQAITNSLSMHLFCLVSIADSFQIIKNCQKAGDNEETERLIQIIKEESYSIVNINNIEGFKPFTLMSPEIVGTALENINKHIFDHIDSQLFLANEKPSKPLDFDKDASVLYIHGQSIKITLKNDKPLDHYILEALFQNDDLSEKAYFSEIAKDIVGEDYNGNWQRYRHACDNLNKKIAKATNNKINEFIEFTTGKTGWCQINPEYL